MIRSRARYVFYRNGRAFRLCTNIEQIVVKGPSVAGGEVNVGVPGKIRHDNTLAYA